MIHNPTYGWRLTGSPMCMTVGLESERPAPARAALDLGPGPCALTHRSLGPRLQTGAIRYGVSMESKIGNSHYRAPGQVFAVAPVLLARCVRIENNYEKQYGV